MVGHLLRDQGYYTAFKGKWHLSEVPKTEDALERYGFSDFQQWGEMFGAPLEGAMLDGSATSEAVDWLEHKAPTLDRPWLLICSLINPHDVMFLQTDPVQKPHPNGAISGMQTTVQRLGWFEPDWDVTMPVNFADGYKRQPAGVRHYKENVDLHYGRIPDDRTDLWLKHRNYLINCMRLADAELNRILAALDRLDLWKDTVVIFTGDHGEMNGAHRMTQKGAIPSKRPPSSTSPSARREGRRTNAPRPWAPTLISRPRSWRLPACAMMRSGSAILTSRDAASRLRLWIRVVTVLEAASTLRAKGRSSAGMGSICSTRIGP
jgi:arylsulfatase A-like enzyme